MAGKAIICAVIPEREDDSTSDKYLVVAPEDRIIWVAHPETDRERQLIGECRKRAITEAKIKSLIAKFEQEECSSNEEGDILELSDEQLDCRDRNSGKCERFPRSTHGKCDRPEGAMESEGTDDGCFTGVLACWMLEDEVD
jgi:hypothetical protein